MSKYLERASSKINLRRFLRKICLNLSTSIWLPSTKRYILVRWGGVNVAGPCFIGPHVTFDTIRPDLISISRDCIITEGCCILSHFLKEDDMYYGVVHIGEYAFIGVHSVIAQSVTIGDNAVVGAGSIVINDIPAGEIWAGNPAHFICPAKKRDKCIIHSNYY